MDTDRNKIKIYIYSGWRKYGIQERLVRIISDDNRTALADYTTSSGSVLPNGSTYRNFKLTYKEALKEAKKEIKKEIDSKKRAIQRLIEINKKLK